MTFASDNWAGACDSVLAALAEANAGPAPAYGEDRWTLKAGELLSAFFERNVAAIYVGTGSAANSLSLGHVYRPGGAAIVHIDSHIARDEAGAPHFYAPGLVLDHVDGPAGRMTPDTIEALTALYGPGDARHGRLIAMSFANVNELGQAYTPTEAAALIAPAKAAGLAVHMDGARLANALAFTGASPADLTWRAGVDILSLGFTKTGAWCAEAVVFFDPQAAGEAAYRQKQAAQMFSKNRFAAAQFVAMLTDGQAAKLARVANGRASELAEIITASSEAALAVPCQSNEVFAHLSAGAADRLANAGIKAYPWDVRSAHGPAAPEEGWRMHRFVASFRTTAGDIKAAKSALAG